MNPMPAVAPVVVTTLTTEWGAVEYVREERHGLLVDVRGDDAIFVRVDNGHVEIVPLHTVTVDATWMAIWRAPQPVLVK